MLAPPASLGAVDVWDYYDEQNVPCGSIRTLLYFLKSPSTQNAHVVGVRYAASSVTITVLGPQIPTGERARTRYEVSREAFSTLSEHERETFRDSLTSGVDVGYIDKIMKGSA